MKITRLLAIGVIAGSVGVGALQAQIREQQPAEFPPASYKGKQYVDSRGCVFIRAGIDGDVSWIPRVTRSRKTVCGFKPSLSSEQVAKARTAPAQKPAKAPVQITVDPAPVTPTAVATAKPKPTATAAATVAAPKPKPRRTATAPVVVRQTAPKPKRRAAAKPVTVVAKPAPTPVVRQQPARQQVATACPDRSPIAQRYLQGDDVRCGPQAAPIGTHTRIIVAGSGATQGATATPREITATTRVVPKHVAINRINTRNVTVPKGYKKVWEDGRLNPYRAEGNLGGRHQMLLIWTNTVPRRLINQSTGRDVTASVPLVYPYLDLATQQRELGEVKIVQRNGKIVKRVIRHANAKPAARQPVYSTRSTPKAAEPKAAPARALAGKRYVQIGLFSTSEKAQRAARNIANLGLRAQIGKVRKGGKSYLSVAAGPFATATTLDGAVSKIRRAGYRDAFVRK